MTKEKFVYYCGYCSKEFVRKLGTEHGTIVKGQQVMCDVGHFIPTLDVLRKAKKEDEE